jgi:hypothetical protein
MIVLAAALLAVSPASPSVCRDGTTADEAVTAVYDLVSVPAGGSWDWDRIGALFVDRGMFVTMIPRVDGAVMSKADLPTLRAQTETAYAKSCFIEREYRRETRIFGDIASIYSSFYIALPQANDRPLARGLHHFQLVRGDGCWRIVSNISQMEGAGWTLSPAFAQKSTSR